MRGLRILAALALVGVVATGGDAQEVVPPVVTEVVRLDAVVTDAKGQPVRGLKAQDFLVLEDGKRQQVTNFTLQESGPGAPPPEGPLAGALPPGEGPAAALPSVRIDKHIVIVVDDLHIAAGNLESTREALRRVASDISPGDQLALVTTAAPQVVIPLTADRETLVGAIGRLSVRNATVPPSLGSQMTPAQAEMILTGNRSARSLAASSLSNEPGSAYDVASPRVAVQAEGSDGAATMAQSAGSRERAAEGEAERQARAVLEEALRFSGASLHTLEGVIRGLASLPGRKICLLVSDGFLTGKGVQDQRTLDARRVVDAATRSGAVVYSLNTQGLVTTGRDASVVGRDTTPGLQDSVTRQGEELFRETLRALADDTGGLFVRGTNDLAAGLQRMLADSDTYYLLAYEPSNPKRDGRFRKIELKLPAHPEYTIRTRSGYYAQDAKAKGDRAPARLPVSLLAGSFMGEAEARRLLAAAPPPGGLSVRLAVDYLDLAPLGSQAVVRAHVDAAGLAWTVEDGRHRATVDLVGGVYDTQGMPLGPPFGKRAELDLSPAEHEGLLRNGLRYQQPVPVPPGRHEVRLAARDPKRGQAGGVSEWLEVPDLRNGKLALSSVFLSSAAAEGEARGEAALRDAETRRSFRRSETLYFQAYVYNPTYASDGSRDVVLQAQVWAGGKALFASKPQPVALLHKDGVSVPETNGMSLSALEAGRYELRVVVVDRKAGANAMRRVEFAVE